MTISAPKQYTIIPGPSGQLNHATLAVQDNNGSYATVVTPWFLNTSGSLQPAQVDASGNLRVTSAGSTYNGPTQLINAGYSSLGASNTYYISAMAKLTRNARARTFLVYNTLNQQVNVSLLMSDSAINDNGSLLSGQAYTGLSATHGLWIATSEQYPILASHVDSLVVGITTGSTAPTSGALQVYVVETF
ncbi:hypothetical protein [Alicyclobacillus sendaiensis]|uniref:hypothetical protein n=1 Tax=Alicyclobacillus sendaiensis TaxID=192387 RepID=UPI0026F47833|nr:hypothetical protein [Alicyclobacillus sendaiensis]